MTTVGLILREPVARRTRQEYLYLVAGLVPAIPAFALALIAVVATALSLFAVGIPLLLLVLSAARFVPTWFLLPARATQGWTWPRIEAMPRQPPLRRAGSVLLDASRWKALAYASMKFPLSLIGAYLGTFSIVAGTLAATYPIWWFVDPDGFGYLDDNTWTRSWLLAAQGAALLLALPWFLRLVVAVDRTLINSLLRPSADHQRVATLETSRATLTADAASTLRRLERDLHDGTQARLVNLGMMLDRIEEHTEDPGQRHAINSAKGAVTDTLAELREIIRGVYPPALDHDLRTALSTLAGRSPIPATLTGDLHHVYGDATKAVLYFATNELLANVARHTDASRIAVELAETATQIVLTVADTGAGGATTDKPSSTGLSGLRRRVEALDGRLDIDSPTGGPTTITLTLPRT